VDLRREYLKIDVSRWWSLEDEDEEGGEGKTEDVDVVVVEVMV
jgi:hypothetical protein